MQRWCMGGRSAAGGVQGWSFDVGQAREAAQEIGSESNEGLPIAAPHYVARALMRVCTEGWPKGSPEPASALFSTPQWHRPCVRPWWGRRVNASVSGTLAREGFSAAMAACSSTAACFSGRTFSVARNPGRQGERQAPRSAPSSSGVSPCATPLPGLRLRSEQLCEGPSTHLGRAAGGASPPWVGARWPSRGLPRLLPLLLPQPAFLASGPQSLRLARPGRPPSARTPLDSTQLAPLPPCCRPCGAPARALRRALLPQQPGGGV